MAERDETPDHEASFSLGSVPSLKRLQLIVRAQQEIASLGRDLDAVERLVADRAREVAGADGAAVGLVEGNAIVYRAVSGDAAPPLGLRAPLGGGAPGEHASTGSGILGDEAEGEISSTLVVPLRYGTRSIGVLAVVSSRRDAFDRASAALLEALAGILAAALTHAENLAGKVEAVHAPRGALEALRWSEERYRSLVTATSQVVWVADANGDLVPNAWWSAITGQTDEEMRGSGWLAAVHPLDRDHVRAAWARALAGSSVYEVEFRVRRTNGTYRDFRSSGAPVHDADGRVREWIGTIVDVTERKDVERRLEESLQRYASLFENNPDAVCSFDLNGNFVDANPSITRLTGHTRDELVGSPFTSLIAPEALREAMQAFLHAVQGVPQAYDTVAIRKDGARRDLRVLNVPIEIGGRIVGVYGIATDVTDQRHAEVGVEVSERRLAMRRKLSTLGALVAGVAHEINTPLQFVMGNAELTRMAIEEILETNRLSPHTEAELREVAILQDTIVGGVEHIARITRSIKRVAHSSSGNRAPHSVNDIMEGVLAVALPRLPDAVEVRREMSATKTALLDAAEMSQVFLNLVLNAGDAMTSCAGALLTVRTFDEGSLVVIEIEDAGDGMHLDVQSQLFTPFFTTKIGSTGLGLCLSHRIVEDHGGRISFTSEPGKGSTFRVGLPQAF